MQKLIFLIKISLVNGNKSADSSEFVLVCSFIVSWYRSSRQKVFSVKGVLKICSKFTGEHPCRSVISIKLLSNFIEITLQYGRSPLNLLHIFRTPFSKNTSRGLCFWHDRWTLYSYGVPHLSCLFYVMECQGISFLSLLFYYVYFVEKFTQSCF